MTLATTFASVEGRTPSDPLNPDEGVLLTPSRALAVGARPHKAPPVVPTAAPLALRPPATTRQILRAILPQLAPPTPRLLMARGPSPSTPAPGRSPRT